MPFQPSRIFAVLCLSLLGGCAQFAPSAGPTALTPPAEWANGSGVPHAAASPATLANWWKQLNDPQLDRLIALAMDAAPDVRIARARLLQARAGRELAVAGLAPRLGGSLAATRSESGGSAQNLYNAGFDASWEADLFGALRYAVAGAEADLQASSAALGAARVSLAAEVAFNYTALRTAQRRLAIARDNLASQAETLEITGWRAQAGLVTQLDVEQARTNYQQTRAAIPALEASRSEAEHHLAILLGQAPGALRGELAEVRPLPAPPRQLALAIPADTLRQRPDVRAAEYSVAAEVARSAQREAARLPSFTLAGTLGWQAFTPAGLGGTLASSITGSLAATLFDGGRLRHQAALQDAVQAQAFATYEKTLLSALEDVENALVAYATGVERQAARRQAALAARNAAELARQLYQSGVVDFQKVLDSERTRLSAEDGLASAEADVLNAAIRLYKALGGGWKG
ncbi:MAG: efflux transporter outer membrane subunit [Sulfuricella sp.]|nr:efflux transporter outer membrane subunit [Sulfuricella sp.]